ncbi:hypothetical protein KM043_018523 [Ampulex compressa]|nr:hypothetical protein KM043_018523 [Ampulex compressa]
MLHAKGLPVKLWAEAGNTVVYLLNRTAIKKHKSVTPFEAWNEKKPELSHVRVFGAGAYVYIGKQFRKKIDKKAKKLILQSHDDKEDMTHESEEESMSETSVPSDKGDGESDEPTVAETTTRTMELRNRAKIKPPKRYGLNLAQYHLPETFQEAISGPDKKLWTKAIEEELDAHEKNETWALVTRQKQKSVILSTTESEYIAASTTLKEAVGLRQLLKDLDYDMSMPTDLYIDNQSAIRLVNNPTLLGRK